MAQYSPQGFRLLPPVVKNLLIINLICWLATMVLERGGSMLPSMLALHSLGHGFMPWQPFTYMFLHANFSHLFFNMFALWMFGYTLENLWGGKRFLWYYIGCGLGAAVVNMMVDFFVPGFRQTVGASGAVYGILLAFAMMFPNEYIYLYFLVPIKTKWFILGFIVLELIDGIFIVDGVAHFAHLGGILTGFIIIKIWQKRQRRNNFRY